jgi:hypothetical protein
VQAFADANPDVLPFVAVSTGTSEKDITKLKAILEAAPGITLICMDVANGYSEHFSTAVRGVRAAHPTHTIIAGNVVTGEMVEQLLLDGADIIKVGIGPGSVCTTRKQTGVGYPQLSAVIECADAAHGMGGHVMADGGCTCPGDIAKAFGAGADYVMCGGMFAGHECVRASVPSRPFHRRRRRCRRRRRRRRRRCRRRCRRRRCRCCPWSRVAAFLVWRSSPPSLSLPTSPRVCLPQNNNFTNLFFFFIFRATVPRLFRACSLLF